MLSIGIVGLPNVGKSTLFNALTNNKALVANYPFATIDPNVGVVAVPDARLYKLHELYPTSKVVPASVTFVDIAGLVKGAAAGEGLGNQFLSHIREANAVCQVVRAFEDPNITHVEGSVNARRDIETVLTELILADLQTLERAFPRLESEAKKDSASKQLLAIAYKAKTILDAGRPLSSAIELEAELAELNDFHFLTAKPFIYVFNVAENDLTDTQLSTELRELAGPAPAIMLSAKLEAELAELSDDDRTALLAEYHQAESGLEQLVKRSYQTLGLQTFLTAGPKEVRAWTIRRGARAPEAAGVIHTDFERGFIKAEIVSFDDLVAAGSLAEARARGRIRLEGKDYVMQEGDVVEFRFNV